MILEETQNRGFTPWDADLKTRQDKTTLTTRTKKLNQNSLNLDTKQLLWKKVVIKTTVDAVNTNFRSNFVKMISAKD